MSIKFLCHFVRTHGFQGSCSGINGVKMEEQVVDLRVDHTQHSGTCSWQFDQPLCTTFPDYLCSRLPRGWSQLSVERGCFLQDVPALAGVHDCGILSCQLEEAGSGGGRRRSREMCPRCKSALIGGEVSKHYRQHTSSARLVLERHFISHTDLGYEMASRQSTKRLLPHLLQVFSLVRSCELSNRAYLQAESRVCILSKARTCCNS